MVKTLLSGNDFIIICDYKEEPLLVGDILDSNIPTAKYIEHPHECSPAIFLSRDSVLPEYNSVESLENLINSQI